MTKYDIYLIWGKDCDGNILRYYGSTSNFIKRKNYHNYNYKRWVEDGRPSKCECKSVYILDNGDWKMEKIDEIIGERWEAKKKEGEYQKNNDCVNVRKENRTVKEWYKDNKERYKQKYKDNKDKILEKSIERYKKNKQKYLEKNKQYYEKHKAELNEKKKQYYEKHKDELNEKNKQKIICECGAESTKNHISRHRKSKKHINLLSNNQKMSNP